MQGSQQSRPLVIPRRSKGSTPRTKAANDSTPTYSKFGDSILITCAPGYIFNHVEKTCVKIDSPMGKVLERMWRSTDVSSGGSSDGGDDGDGGGDDGGSDTGMALRSKRVVDRSRYSNVNPMVMDARRSGAISFPEVSSAEFVPFVRRLLARRKLVMGAAPDENACASLGESGKGIDLEAYQKVLGLLVSPDSPVRRVLVKADTGAGKTCYAGPIIEAWKMRRPVFIIVPGDAQKDNAYYQLSHKCPSPLQKMVAKAKLDWKRGEADQSKIVGLFSRSRVFVLSYVQAANKINGRNTTQRKGEPKPGPRYLDEAVILLDEIHYLANLKFIHPSWKSSVEALSPAIVKARDSVVIGFTATPIVEDPLEVVTLLNIFRGEEVMTRADFRERFVTTDGELGTQVLTSDPERLRELELLFRGIISVYENQNDTHRFPRMTPTRVHSIALGPDQIHKLRESKAKDKSKFVNIAPASAMRSKVGKALRSDAELRMVSPKLHAVVELLQRLHAERAGKVLLFSQQKRTGADILADILQARGWDMFSNRRATGGDNGSGGNAKSARSFAFFGNYSGASRERAMSQAMFTAHLDAFNDEANKTGQNIPLAILTKDKATGINFEDVRHIILVEAPDDMSTFHQVLGRARRYCSHRRLPRDMWTIDVHVFQSILPGEDRDDGELHERARLLQAESEQLAQQARVVEDDLREVETQIAAVAEQTRALPKAARGKQAAAMKLSRPEFDGMRDEVDKVERVLVEYEQKVDASSDAQFKEQAKTQIAALRSDFDRRKRVIQEYVRANLPFVREDIAKRRRELLERRVGMQKRLRELQAKAKEPTKTYKFIEAQRKAVHELRSSVRTDAHAFADAKVRDATTQSMYDFMRRVAVDCEANKARTGVDTCLFSELHEKGTSEGAGVRGDDLVQTDEHVVESTRARQHEGQPGAQGTHTSTMASIFDNITKQLEWIDTG